jgi:ABC-type nitrate/sulfonate/bicarbonate transport system substrate-binding protein
MPSTAPTDSAAPSATPSASVALEDVRVALDWTPNTDHTGFYVAAEQGWYADAGVNLKLLPYNTTAPETLIAAGQTECGISFQDAMTFAYAAGAPITSVMAILQHTASAIAVLGDSPIARPRDLDGKTYGGFGYPADHPTIQVVIKHDGGKGVFKEVTLNTGAYQAMYSKQVDFTIVFTAWEGVEAKELGHELRYFKATDYGFPDSYQVVLACNTDWLAKNPDLARRFIAATVQGFQFANDNPAEAAGILIAANPGIFDANPALPQDSAAYMAEQGLYVNDAGLVGPQTLDRWTAYSSFLYREGLLVDGHGKPLTAPPDYSKLFTNDFLPGGP